MITRLWDRRLTAATGICTTAIALLLIYPESATADATELCKPYVQKWEVAIGSGNSALITKARSRASAMRGACPDLWRRIEQRRASRPRRAPKIPPRPSQASDSQVSSEIGGVRSVPTGDNPAVALAPSPPSPVLLSIFPACGETAKYRFVEVVYLPDGAHIVTTCYDAAWLWNLTTGKSVRGFSWRRLNGPAEMIKKVTSSPNGRLLLAALYDGDVSIFDRTTSKMSWTLKGHKHSVKSYAFSADGNRVLTASEDETAIFWDLTTGKRLRQLKGHQHRVVSVDISSDGMVAYTVSSDGTARVWNLSSGKELRRSKLIGGFIRSAAFFPGSANVLTGSDDKIARLWNVTTGNELRRLGGHDGAISCVAISPYGAYALTGSEDKTVRLWALSSSRQIARIKVEAGVTSVAFSPDGSRALIGSADGNAREWSLATLLPR